MSDWWKAPVLQGPENDYGDYDYLIEELPQNEARWELSKYKWKCDQCGKESHLLFCYTGYFRTMDGYDSSSYNECWLCMIKDYIHRIKWRIIVRNKKRIKILNLAKEMYGLYKSKNCHKSFKECYKLAKKIER